MRIINAWHIMKYGRREEERKEEMRNVDEEHLPKEGHRNDGVRLAGSSPSFLSCGYNKLQTHSPSSTHLISVSICSLLLLFFV